MPLGSVSRNDGFPKDMIGRPRAVQVRYDTIWPEETPILMSGQMFCL